MYVTPAFAQGTTGGGTDTLLQLLPIVLIFVIFYFLIIRPQQQRMKAHREMVSGLRRGDMIVSGGGIVGKITKVIDDREIQVEIADGVRIRLIRDQVQEVRTKSEPVKDT